MNKLTKQVFIIFLIAIFFIAALGCLKTDTKKANDLIDKANKAIKKYTAIENEDISPLRGRIDRTEASKEGAKDSLYCTKKILKNIKLQNKVLKKAKTDIKSILALAVSSELKNYTNLTVKALDADLNSLTISKKLYGELKKMYELIAYEKLSQKEYENITSAVSSLSNAAEKAADDQQKLHAKKDAYYKEQQLGK
ncbi:MAG: hypothetical protein E3J54_05075 [Actinobacteria bacterium]|nr:MAG: hypothetical protein E3J54_05075 [Actinomycetota bacterium]